MNARGGGHAGRPGRAGRRRAGGQGSAWGAAEYEIDLSAANAGRFRGQLGPFIENARKAGRARPGRTVSALRSSAEVRAWARDYGIGISERGRMPASVTEQYESATA